MAHYDMYSRGRERFTRFLPRLYITVCSKEMKLIDATAMLCL